MKNECEGKLWITQINVVENTIKFIEPEADDW